MLLICDSLIEIALFFLVFFGISWHIFLGGGLCNAAYQIVRLVWLGYVCVFGEVMYFLDTGWVLLYWLVFKS